MRTRDHIKQLKTANRQNLRSRVISAVESLQNKDEIKRYIRVYTNCIPKLFGTSDTFTAQVIAGATLAEYIYFGSETESKALWEDATDDYHSPNWVLTAFRKRYLDLIKGPD